MKPVICNGNYCYLRKSKPKLVSGPLFRVRDQSIVIKHHHSGIEHIYQVLFGRWFRQARFSHVPNKTWEIIDGQAVL